MTDVDGARRRDLITHSEAASFSRNEIDPKFLMPERCSHRAGQIEVSTAGFRIDVGRAAAAVAPVNAKQPLSDPDVAAHPIELLPGSRSVDVEIRPKPQRIDFDPPLFLEDQIDPERPFVLIGGDIRCWRNADVRRIS
nr:hypothetical protein [Bradyrhizobium erythrophlei]